MTYTKYTTPTGFVFYLDTNGVCVPADSRNVDYVRILAEIADLRSTSSDDTIAA